MTRGIFKRKSEPTITVQAFKLGDDGVHDEDPMWVQEMMLDRRARWDGVQLFVPGMDGHEVSAAPGQWVVLRFAPDRCGVVSDAQFRADYEPAPCPVCGRTPPCDEWEQGSPVPAPRPPAPLGSIQAAAESGGIVVADVHVGTVRP